MKKEQRQAKIEQIITQNEIATQDELMKALSNVGIKATQATISRDIREMRIIKEQDANGQVHYVIFKGNRQSEEEKLFENIHEMVTDITQVEFINIIHTLPRNANVLTAIIDDLNLKEVVGTMAGYDTILIISKSREDARTVSDLFKKYIDENNVAD
ncbi:arginine pathway regulatory protein ArgR [Liquorilactobacillus sucicola DSM 21376 = JCM 15457]|uniref:Arginine repressor n=1 Tax=Liquorilactobacillus sucicola DSM 21376 = JCM 15457 TaxID=1423806 RepID=A0A023CUM0_9LACO|nr:arginine repressor [Liquorilactobacillus sucicola]KRN05146.1 arginine repressor [Liquorilactobacillus sucicola DSM 21376 = JCM 15457]GAJ25195.1 arginine pathway regulatory protein ArgR [Liquorilactobacillus sucicola DSM 21376 = JCM 15457]